MKHSCLLLSRLSRDTERAGELRFTQGLLCAKKSTRVVALHEILSHLLEPVLLGEGSEKGGDLLGY